MAKHKTMKERKALAEALEELKPRVRETSIFGDNHHDAIDIQIQLLRGEIEVEEFEEKRESEEITDSVYDAGSNVLGWMDGTGEDDILAEWKELEQ